MRGRGGGVLLGREVNITNKRVNDAMCGLTLVTRFRVYVESENE